MGEIKEDIYKDNGYENRKDYLQCMSDDYGVPLEVVESLADVLGESEMFDGLVSALEDAEELFCE